MRLKDDRPAAFANLALNRLHAQEVDDVLLPA